MSSINRAPVRRLIRNRGKKREGTQGESLAKTRFIDRIPKWLLGSTVCCSESCSGKRQELEFLKVASFQYAPYEERSLKMS